MASFAQLIVEAKGLGITFTGQTPEVLQQEIDTRRSMLSGNVNAVLQELDSTAVLTTKLRHQLEGLRANNHTTDAVEVQSTIREAIQNGINPQVADQVRREVFSGVLEQVFPSLETANPSTKPVTKVDPSDVLVPVIVDESSVVDDTVAERPAPTVGRLSKKSANVPKAPKTVASTELVAPNGKTKSQLIIDLWVQGKPKAEIARMVPAHYSQVHTVIKKWQELNAK